MAGKLTLTSENQSFGVASHLAPKARVYYENVYTSRHLGKVCDLFTAKLRKEGIDELKFRQIVTFAFFEAYRTQVEGPQRVTPSDDPLPAPLLIEIGLDEGVIAVGIAINLRRISGIAVDDDFEARISGGNPKGEMEALLVEISKMADGLVLKYQSDTKRLEFIAMVAIPGKEFPLSKKGVQYFSLPDKTAEPQKPEKYEALADVDYNTLLKDDAPGKGLRPSPTGKMLADSARAIEEQERIQRLSPEERQKEEAARAKGGKTGADDADARVKGSGGDLAGAQRVKGRADDDGDFKNRISGITDELKDEILRVGPQAAFASGGAFNKFEGDVQSLIEKRMQAQASLYQAQIDTLQKKISLLENERANAKTLVRTGSALPDIDTSNPGGFLKNIWPFGKKKEAAAQQPPPETSPSAESPEPPAEKGASAKTQADADTAGRPEASPSKGKAPATSAAAASNADDTDPSNEAAPAGDTDSEKGATRPPAATSSDGTASEVLPPDTPVEVVAAKIAEAEKKAAAIRTEEVKVLEKTAQTPTDPAAENAANDLSSEIQSGGFQNTVLKLQTEASNLKKEVSGNVAATKMVDSMFNEVVAERGRLTEMAKRLQTALKAKEAEFRRKALMLVEEVKKRDDILKQKNFALGQSKGQMDNLQTAIKTLKTAAAKSGSEASVKMKLAHAEKMQNMMKEENLKLTKRLDETRRQLTASQNATKMKGGPTAAEISELKTKMERNQKLMDELKKNNLQLTEKLNEAKKEKTASTQMIETKNKLEETNRSLVIVRKENEKLRHKAEEAQREKLKLEMEVAKLRSAAKVAATKPSPPGSSGGSNKPTPGGSKAA